MTAAALRRLYVLALGVGAVPLWIGHLLPLVDLPQHLHLISVLHRLDDPTTLYPRLFAARNVLTPYLGYYYAVSGLHWLLPLDVANRVFLTAYVVGLPLSLGFLLRSLGRPRWPSLLGLPFAYGDSFGWGFINFCVSLPLAILCVGLFTRALQDAPHRRRWAVLHAAALAATLLFHVQAFAYLALALPLILLTTSVPDRALSARWPALLSVVPGVLLFAVSVGTRLGQPAEIAPGVPWKAWGPLLSRENLSFLPWRESAARLIPSLGNLLRDGSDQWGVRAAAAVTAVAWALWLTRPASRGPQRESRLERARLPALALIAGVLYFVLPFDIRGYLYYLSPRYAHLLAALALIAVPPLAARWRAPFMVASGLCVALTAGALARGFHAFDAEARGLVSLRASTAERPVVMGLLYDSGSRVRTHPVFLHAAADLARAKGGTSHFSFALQPHIPVRYKVAPPRAPASEWRPDQFRYDEMGPDYDHFLVRGVPPQRVLGAPLERGELVLVGQTEGWYLLRRRTP